MALTVQYHEIRGLAAPLRMMLRFSGVEYENKFADTWFSHDKAVVKETNALANLPVVFDSDQDHTVTQSCAAFWYIGEKCGLNGKNDSERSRVDQIVCQVQDLRNGLARFVYAPRRADGYVKYAQSAMQHFSKLEGVFRRSGYLFSAANRPTTGDFHLFEMLDQHEELARMLGARPISSECPHLSAFYARFYALPQLQEYFSGPEHALPHNNINFAWFGGENYPLKPVADEEGAEGGEKPNEGADKIVVGYWKIRGLCAPLRMMCTYAGADFESKEYLCSGTKSKGYDRSAWNDVKGVMSERNPMINLPYVQCGTDLVTQSNACVSYLGRKFDLMGSNLAESARVMQVMWETTDMRNGAVGEFYGGDPENAERVAAYIKKATASYEKLEGFVKQGGKQFSAADAVTAADFHLFEMLDQHEEYAKHTGNPSFLDSYPTLKAFYARFRALPQLQKYFDGPMHKLPVNNPMAGFGPSEDYSKHSFYNKQ